MLQRRRFARHTLIFTLSFAYDLRAAAAIDIYAACLRYARH